MSEVEGACTNSFGMCRPLGDIVCEELERLHKLGLYGEHLRRAWISALKSHNITAKPRNDHDTVLGERDGLLFIEGWVLGQEKVAS